LLAWQLRRAGLSRLAGLLLLALGVQISLGIGNVVFHLPLVLAVAHNAGGALLLLTLVLVNYRVRSSSRRSQLAVARHSGDPVVRQRTAGMPDHSKLASTGQ
jgi:cytochrome c oxidase assembly protein subunit 15